MIEFTQKQIRQMVEEGFATDLSIKWGGTIDDIINQEGRMIRIGVSYGYYGLAGALYKGEKTGSLYAVQGYSSNLYRLG